MSPVKRVFRIETANGHGICHSAGLCGDYHREAGGECPANSFGKHNMDAALACRGWNGYRYAFPSLDAARRWFPSDVGRQVMANHGGHVVEYEVPVREQIIPDLKGQQVLFPYGNAKRVAEHDLVTLV
jgi:hypothetical protein